MIETSLADGIATVRLAAPATANALTPAAFAELTAAIVGLHHEDGGARVLVLTGMGKVFSAGANLDVQGVTDAKALAHVIEPSVDRQRRRSQHRCAHPVQQQLADDG